MKALMRGSFVPPPQIAHVVATHKRDNHLPKDANTSLCGHVTTPSGQGCLPLCGK